MTNAKITAETFLNDKELREQTMERVEVLDKVKQLFLIPELECMTGKQVADYFEVDPETIKKQYQRNRDEFDSDGAHTKQLSAFKNLGGTRCPFKNMAQQNGKMIITLDDDTRLEIPNHGIKCYPKRAVLRMGMLLRDSRVAKEVRTQLLNTFEHATVEQRTAEINEEERLLLDAVKSMASGDNITAASCFTKYIDYKNRYIAKIEQHNAELSQENAKISEQKEKVEEINKGLATTNAVLVKEQSKWEHRSIINALIRAYAGVVYSWSSSKYGTAFNDYYKQLKYKYHIDIDSRWIRNNKVGQKIAYIRRDELDRAVKLAVAMCEHEGINTGKIINEVNSESAKTTNKSD